MSQQRKDLTEGMITLKTLGILFTSFAVGMWAGAWADRPHNGAAFIGWSATITVIALSVVWWHQELAAARRRLDREETQRRETGRSS